MDKFEYFRLFLRNKLYRKAAWVFPLFSIVTEDSNSEKTLQRAAETPATSDLPAKKARLHQWLAEKKAANSRAYKPVYTVEGYGYVNPDDENKVIKLTGCKLGEPMFTAKDKITLQPGDLASITAPIETTVGRALLNAILFDYVFGNRMPYVNEKLTPGKAETMVLERVENETPTDPSLINPNKIYVSDYIKFTNAAFYLCNFSQLFVPGATRKTMTPPPGLKELKDKLVKENAGKLRDPVVLAKITEELQKLDAEYLKGDPGAEGFLITAKSRKIVRSKLFLLYGAEPGLVESNEVDTVVNSLEEGWDVKSMPAYINAQRAGSFKRGSDTMMGGESVKWLLRASTNVNILDGDCGSTMGIPVKMTTTALRKYKGFSGWLDGKLVVVGDGDSGSSKVLQDRTLLMRSPMFCKLGKTDYCKCCAGPRLSLNPDAASSAISGYGSKFMLLYMKAAHAKGTTLAELNIEDSIF